MPMILELGLLFEQLDVVGVFEGQSKGAESSIVQIICLSLAPLKLDVQALPFSGLLFELRLEVFQLVLMLLFDFFQLGYLLLFELSHFDLRLVLDLLLEHFLGLEFLLTQAVEVSLAHGF